MISRIVAEAFKTPRFDVSLGSATFVAGPAGAGKTAVAEAAKFAGLGFVPGIGRDQESVEKLYCRDASPRMRVAVEFEADEGPQSFERTFLPNGEERTDNAASWIDASDSNRTQRSAAIAGLFGATINEAEQNLNIGTMLAETGRALAAVVEKLLDAGGLSAEERVQRGVALLRARVDSLRKPKDGLLQPHDDATLAALEAIAGELARLLRDDGSAKALGIARDRLTDANRRNKEAMAPRTALEERLVALRAPAETTARLQKRRTECVEQLARLDEQIKQQERVQAERDHANRDLASAAQRETAAIERLEAARLAAAAIDGLRKAIDEIVEPADPANPQIVEVDEATLQIETAQLRERLAAIVDPPSPPPLVATEPDPAEIARATEFESAAAEKRRAADAVAVTPVPGYADEAYALQRAESELSTATAAPWREVEKIAGEIQAEFGADDFLLGDNPADKAADRLRDLAREHGGDIAALTAARASAEKALAAAKAAHENAKALREAEENRVAGLRAEAGELIAEALRIRDAARSAADHENRNRIKAHREATKANQDAKEAADRVRAEICGAIEATERRHREIVAVENASRREAFEIARQEARQLRANAASDRGARQARIDALQGELRAAEKERDEVASAIAAARARLEGIAAAVGIDEQQVRDQIAALKATLGTVDEHLKTAKSADSLRDELHRLAKVAEQAYAESKVWAAAVFACERLRDQEMSARSAGFEARMTEFLAAAGRQELPFLRCRGGKAEFGWRTPRGREVPIETLSGAQSILFRSALAYAVLMVRNPRLKLLTVELAECSDGRVNTQVLRALDAIKDRVQVLVTSCVPTAVPEGWTRIDVAGEDANEEMPHAA